MAAQNPVKLEEVYDHGKYKRGSHYHDEEGSKQFMSIEKAEELGLDLLSLAHKENIEKSTMPYQWGVWCTAHARYRLELAIRICGNDFLYCDTDSVYYYNEHSFDQYNKDAIADSKQHGAYAADPKGKEHYMGVLELDKDGIKSFKTMGAKKYAYIDNKNELHITIAGVSKRAGAEELKSYAKSHGLVDGLDAMQESFVFSAAGGTESIYNDVGRMLVLDGREVYCPSNVAIKPSTYSISLAPTYKELLLFLLDNDLFRLYKMNYEGQHLPSIDI